MPRTPRTPVQPPLLEIDPGWVAAIGTAIWAVAALAFTLWGRDALADHDRTWWLGTAYSGVVIGILGTLHCRRRTRNLNRRKD